MNNKRKSLILTGILLGVSMYTLMQTVVATVLPIASQEIGDSELYGWVFSGYLMMSTITIPIFSKLADSCGYKRFFLIGMSVFLTGTVFCAAADSFEILVAARILQGIGAGVLSPVTMALISNLYPTELRGKVFSLFAVVQLLSNILGPLIGGIIAENFGWNAPFWFILPLGVFSLTVLIFAKIPHLEAKNSSKNIDYIGALLLGASIALFIQTWSVFESKGWTLTVILLFTGSISLLILFLLAEKHQINPVISPNMIRIPNVSIASICAMFSGILNYGTIMLFPLLATVIFQNSSSYLLLVPLMIGVSMGMIISGKLSASKPYKTLVRTAWFLCAVSLCIMCILCFIQVIMELFFVLAFIAGSGLGILMPAIILPAQNSVADNQQATVSGTIQLSRNIGGAVGIPIITSIVSVFEGISGYGFVFLFLLVICLIGLLLSRYFQGSAAHK